MPTITDPMDGLTSFAPAFAAKKLEVEKCRLDPTIWVHLDSPQGTPRFTYVRARGHKVTAMVILVPVEPIEGVPCFGVGYAVPEDERGKGHATELVTAAIAELQAGFAVHGLTEFWVEAVVDQGNIPSQKVAAATLSSSPRPGTDSLSGTPIFVYARRYGADI